ncbi:hypothetical protein [Amycolatopsis japonica]
MTSTVIPPSPSSLPGMRGRPQPDKAPRIPPQAESGLLSTLLMIGLLISTDSIWLPAYPRCPQITSPRGIFFPNSRAADCAVCRMTRAPPVIIPDAAPPIAPATVAFHTESPSILSR